MNKYLLILVLMTIQLFSSEAIKLKVIQNNELVEAKFLIKSPMIGEEKANQRNIEADFITRILIESNEQVIYDIFTNQNIAKNPFFKFSYKNTFYTDTIKFTTIDNKNKKITSIFGKNDILNKWEVQKSTVGTSKGLLISEKIWSIMNINEAIKELYGNADFKYGDEIQVTLPKFTHKLHSIPIKIKSNLNLESIAIFQDREKYSTVAIIKIPSAAIIDYLFHFKMNVGCDNIVAIVAKGKDGTIYRKDKLISTAPHDANCDGTSVL